MTENAAKINWYPGHMEKARRQIRDNMKLMDMVIEVRDARIPLASANPVLGELIGDRPRLIVLAKADLADPAVTERWVKALSSDTCIVLPMDLKDGKDVRKKIVDAAKKLTKTKYEKMKSKGIRNPRAMRAMACGIPNSGKSTLINRINGRASLKTADHPGVTRTLTWIHADPYLDILDTPGVLWPKFDDQNAAALLAVTGAINDQILDLKEIACVLIRILKTHYPGMLEEAYGVNTEGEPYEVLRSAAEARLILKDSGEADEDRAAGVLVREFRKGKTGRVSLEFYEENESLSE